ncbi:hypothetical protein Tco_1061016, partial [Tanacetum coccineum]
DIMQGMALFCIAAVETDGGRSSRVPIPLLDDPNMAVRQSYLATITDSEFEPFKDSRETEIPQSLPIASSPVPPSDDPYLIVGQVHTPATIDNEFEPAEAPLETKEFQPLVTKTTPPSSDQTPISSNSTPVSPLIDEEFEAFEPSDTRITSSHSTAPSDSTTPLSPDHPLTQTSPTPTRVSYYHSTARMVRYRSSYEMPSPSSSLTLPIRKSYRGTSELVEDTKDESSDSDTEREGSEDEGPGLEEEEEVAPEGQQQVVSVVDTTTDEPLGLGYRALRRRELPLGEGSVPSTFEIGQSSRPVSEQQRVKETPTPRPHVCATWVDPVDVTVYTDIPIYVPPVRVPVQTPPSPEWSFSSTSFTIIPSSSYPTQLELHGSILHDHTQRLDALPSTLFEGYDRDLRELYNRPVLALESWAGHVDAQREEMWQARYDDHRLIHDLLVQNTTMQRELQEMRDRVTILERGGSRSYPATIDTESEPDEAPSETKEFQSLAAKTTPPPSYHTLISSDSTPVSPLIDEEFEAFEPSNTRITSSYSIAPSDSTTPLSHDHPLTQTSPTPTRVSYYRSTARMAVRTQPTLSPSMLAYYRIIYKHFGSVWFSSKNRTEPNQFIIE